jgi:hypothetical protein
MAEDQPAIYIYVLYCYLLLNNHRSLFTVIVVANAARFGLAGTLFLDLVVYLGTKYLTHVGNLEPVNEVLPFDFLDLKSKTQLVNVIPLLSW